MLFFKSCIFIIYLSVFLSHKGLAPRPHVVPEPSAVASSSSSSLSSSEIPYYLRHLKHPLNAEDVYEERERCKNEVYSVFSIEKSPLDHARHAFINLTRLDNLETYVLMYFNSFDRHLNFVLSVYGSTFGRINRITAHTAHNLNVPKFCKEHFIASADICKQSIISLFNTFGARENLVRAFYYLNTRIIYATQSQYIIDYYKGLYSHMNVDLEEKENKTAFRTVVEFCEHLIQKTPPPYKLDLNDPLPSEPETELQIDDIINTDVAPRNYTNV